MIKVEVMKKDNGISSIYFETSNIEADRDTLDEINRLLVDSLTRRGRFADGKTLRIDIKENE